MFGPLLYTTLNQQSIRWNNLAQNVDPWTLAIQQQGRHIVVEGQWRASQSGTAINLQNRVNGDLTGGNYHGQRHLASNGAASNVEVTGANGMQIGGSTGVAAYYSQVMWICPNYRVAGRDRVWHSLWTLEDAALSQQFAHTVSKRQGGSVVGSLTDPITSVDFANALANVMDGTAHWAIVG